MKQAEASTVQITDESTGRYRQLKGVWRLICLLLTAAGIIFFLVYTFSIRLPFLPNNVLMQAEFIGLMLAVFLPLGFLIIPATKKAPRDKVPRYDIILALLSTVGPLFVVFTRRQTEFLAWDIVPPMSAVFIAWLTTLLLIEGARRTGGPAFMVVVAFFTFFPFFAGHMPGFLIGISYDPVQVAGFNLLSRVAITGITTRIMGLYVIPLLFMGAVIQLGGAGTLILNCALSVFGAVRGGAAKVAVVGSALFAGINGSPIANVITTGTVTIPMMKKGGYPPVYAGAIEAVSSNGGIITPPIMGSVAFIMAEFLKVTYAEVALAAAVPAFLYFLAIFIQSDLYAVKTRLPAVPRAQLPSLIKTLKEGSHLVIGILVFIYFVFVLRWDVAASCVIATVALILLSYFRRETRLGPKRLLEIMERCAALFAELTPLLAAAGLVVGSLALTGTGMSVAHMVGVLGGQSILLTLMLAAAASFVLGMGLITTACYILVAVVVAPGLETAGIYPMSGHLFILWWGVISGITPPVALTAMAAAGLAQASYWQIGWKACRLGIVAFIVPFLFVFQPALLLHGEPLVILQSIGAAIFAVLFLCSAIEGYMYGVGEIGMVRRLLFTGAGLLLFIPGNVQYNLIGIVLGALLMVEGLTARRFKRKVAK